jgi:transcription elongation factor Elf1
VNTSRPTSTVRLNLIPIDMFNCPFVSSHARSCSTHPTQPLPPPELFADLSDPIDVYAEWIDAAEEAEKQKEGGGEDGAITSCSFEAL